MKTPELKFGYIHVLQ